MRRRIPVCVLALVALGCFIAVLLARRERHPIYAFLDVVEHADTFTIDIDVFDPDWRMTDSFHVELTDSEDVRAVAKFFAGAQPDPTSGPQQLIRGRKRDWPIERFSLTATSGDNSQTVKFSTDSCVVLGGSEAIDLKGLSANALYAWLRSAGRLKPASRPVMRPPPTTLPAQRNDRHTEAVLAFLQHEHQAPALRDDGRPAYWPATYMPKRFELHLLNTPVLDEYLPDIHFYVTEIPTHHHELPEVPVVLSATSTADGIDVRECLSPQYEAVRPEFLEQFIGLRAESDAARERLCFAIGELLAAITHEGNLRNGASQESVFLVELWQGRIHHFRNIFFTFDSAAQLREIDPVHPRSRP
jgi:hypothetical protein